MGCFPVETGRILPRLLFLNFNFPNFMNSDRFTSTSRACGICGEASSHLIESTDRHGDPLRVVVCLGCGVVHNDPIPDAVELAGFYSKEYRSAYKGTCEPRLRHAARYFRSASRHIRRQWKFYEPARSVLDIGSGSGEFLFLMKELGKSVKGLEPNVGYSDFCRKRLGLDIRTGEIDSFEPGERFDHIRLSHVVEHLRDPVDKLRRVAGWLSEGGTLYVEVPDFETYCAKKTPGKIFHYGHIYNFDRDSFERLVAAAGLRIVERAGATAAFLTRSDGPCGFGPISPARVEEKVGLYQAHRSGRLRKRSRWARILGKLARFWKDHRVVVSVPDHVAIGKSAVGELKKRLPVVPVVC